MEHRTREDFVRDFFETAKANGIDVTAGYKFNYNDENLPPSPNEFPTSSIHSSNNHGAVHAAP
jgi:hypothetical protein